MASVALTTADFEETVFSRGVDRMSISVSTPKPCSFSAARTRVVR